MAKHESKWTAIYWDTDMSRETGERLRPYVRLTPEFMDTEAAGFPHGVGFAGFFDTVEQAIAYAERIDKFMDAMIEDYEDRKDEQ